MSDESRVTDNETLVERLRAFADDLPGYTIEPFLRAAADEIERLLALYVDACEERELVVNRLMLPCTEGSTNDR